MKRADSRPFHVLKGFGIAVVDRLPVILKDTIATRSQVRRNNDRMRSPVNAAKRAASSKCSFSSLHGVSNSGRVSHRGSGGFARYIGTFGADSRTFHSSTHLLRIARNNAM
jgi:hypothetical protein